MRHGACDLRVSGLSVGETHSLSAALATAAIAAEPDPDHRALLVPRRRNRILTADQIEIVIREWTYANECSDVVVARVPPRDRSEIAALPRRARLPGVERLVRTPR